MSNSLKAIKKFVDSGGRVSRDGKFVFGITGREVVPKLGGREGKKYYR